MNKYAYQPHKTTQELQREKLGIPFKIGDKVQILETSEKPYLGAYGTIFDIIVEGASIRYQYLMPIYPPGTGTFYEVLLEQHGKQMHGLRESQIGLAFW